MRRHLPLLVPAALLALTPLLSPWGRMWTLILASFYAAKWATWRRALRHGARASWVRHAGYLWTWPGMHAAAFLDARRRPARPARAEWLLALGKTVLGPLLIWVACPQLARAGAAPLVVGWVGVVGLGFTLFFGLFHLLSLAWRRAGVSAPPQWRWPLLATSVNDFWSNRWNRAFSRMSLDLIFRPAARRLGSGGALTLVYAISGLAHEVVLSLPARGGFGLPTAYFLLQAAVIAWERRRSARRTVSAGGPLVGWLRTLLLTGLPAYALFHPPFIEAVMLPGLRVLGAT